MALIWKYGPAQLFFSQPAMIMSRSFANQVQQGPTLITLVTTNKDLVEFDLCASIEEEANNILSEATFIQSCLIHVTIHNSVPKTIRVILVTYVYKTAILAKLRGGLFRSRKTRLLATPMQSKTLFR